VKARRPYGVDTSVAVPYIHGKHPHFARVNEALVGRKLKLCGHAAVETYSVLTRLPGDARLSAKAAVHLMLGSFGGEPLTLKPDTFTRVPSILAERGIFGGAVYDGLVALAAIDNNAILLTRDTRALATYDALGVEVEVLAV